MCKTCKSCFVNGTLVETFEGILKPIEEYQGVLISEDNETEILKVTFSNNEIVLQSKNHPLFDINNKLCLPSFGVKVKTAEGVILEISNIEKIDIEPQKLYNIETIIEASIKVSKSKIHYADAETCLIFNNENKY